MKIVMMILAFLVTTTWVEAMPSDQDLINEVDRLVARWEGDQSPGGAVALIVEGRPVLVKAFGMADLSAGSSNSAETLFYLASLAKPFTAASVVHAARAGKIDLDSSVRDLFPELPKSFAAATIRHLIHHSSGIPDVYDTAIACDLGPAVLGSSKAGIGLICKMTGPSFSPGERCLYSNSGYLLLAESLGRSTDLDLAAYSRKHFFDPLEMNRVSYLGEKPRGEVAVGYHVKGGVWEGGEILTNLRGPGGMFASMTDLVRFESAWWDGKYGDRKLQAALVVAPRGGHNPKLGPYASGWMLQRYRGLNVERHFGGAFDFSTDLLRFPSLGTTVITLSNASSLSATDLSEQVADFVLRDEFKSPESEGVELTRGQIAAFGRLWKDTSTLDIWFLTPRASGFVVAALGDLKLSLEAVEPKRLEATDSHIPFALELKEKELLVHQDGRVIATLESIPFPPRQMREATDYAGEYTSRSLGATITLVAAPRGMLKLQQRRPILGLPPFMPIASDLYVCDLGATMVFERSAQGRVSGMTIHANRAWDLRFDKVRN